MSSRNANKRRKVKGLSSKSSEDTVVDFELELENSEIMNKLVTEFAKVATTLEKMVKERQHFTSGLVERNGGQGFRELYNYQPRCNIV